MIPTNVLSDFARNYERVMEETVMQNRYTGDIGDYGKYGLLRSLQHTGISIGINWYLTPDESNGDGRYTSYLEQGLYRSCDAPLWDELKNIIHTRRSVEEIEKREIIEALYYSKMLDFTDMNPLQREKERTAWHSDALEKLHNNDIIFLDPDNGLMVPSAEKTKRSNKYISAGEIRDYYDQGSSVMYYQHKARKKDTAYLNSFHLLLRDLFPDAAGISLKFTTTSQRYYFLILKPIHFSIIMDCVRDTFLPRWSDHFILIS